jgi:hypothetical protein
MFQSRVLQNVKKIIRVINKKDIQTINNIKNYPSEYNSPKYNLTGYDIYLQNREFFNGKSHQDMMVEYYKKKT